MNDLLGATVTLVNAHDNLALFKKIVKLNRIYKHL